MQPKELNLSSDDKERLIIELPKAHVKLIGQLLHLHLADGNYNPIGQLLLNELITQTDCVLRDPKDHRVYVKGDMPSTAVRTANTWYLPYDQKCFDEQIESSQ